jgi:hypothetical protein
MSDKRLQQLRNRRGDENNQICDKIRIAASARIVTDIDNRKALNCTFTIFSEPTLPIIGVAPNLDYPDDGSLYQTAVSAYFDVPKALQVDGSIADHKIGTDENIKLGLIIGVWVLFREVETLCIKQIFLECKVESVGR